MRRAKAGTAERNMFWHFRRIFPGEPPLALVNIWLGSLALHRCVVSDGMMQLLVMEGLGTVVRYFVIAPACEINQELPREALLLGVMSAQSRTSVFEL
jgi:hypothetical protein